MNNDINKFFRWKCAAGLKKLSLQTSQYIDRLNYELGVIEKMGFATYFLVVNDFLSWARNNGIYTGPGRGSVAGSLVAYVLNITDIDPIKYDLYFERFLNPDRISMPDIDLDFQDDRRDEVIAYTTQKYKHVAGISTFGTMSCRGAIRAAARTLGADYLTGDTLSKLTPPPVNGVSPKLSKCYEQVPQLKAHYASTTSIESRVLHLADQIEDRIDKAGGHASGFVIGDRPLHEIVPLVVRKEVLCTEWNMNEIEKIGLIKFDFLGLTALTVIAKTIQLIKQRHGVTINLRDIPDYDEATFKRLQAGDNIGVFQIETSSGMRDLMVKMQPKSIADLGMLTAIFRPGPLSADYLSHWLKVRAGEASPEYISPLLEPILSETDGFLIYQESCMKMAVQLAGYTAAESDSLRKAIGKKLPEEMAKQETKFKQGLLKSGLTQGQTNKLWDDIKGFAAYSFNKCISGDTKIYRGSCNKKNNQVSIAHLFKVKNNKEYWKTNKYKSLHDKLTCKGYGEILALDGDGRIRPRRIKDIIFTGKKEIFQVNFSNGNNIKATKDHKFFTPNGFVKVENFICNETQVIIDDGYEISDFRVMNRFSDKNAAWKMQPYAEPKKGFFTGNYNPAYTNGSFTEFEAVKKLLESVNYCQWCGATGIRLEHNHINGDRTNSNINNINKLCSSCHKKSDYAIGKRKKKWQKGHKTAVATVISIEYINIEDTYDIEMDSAEHNFIANGFVSSNSHSIAYGQLAYQTAWLKTHYTVEYMCSELTCNQGKTDKIIKYIFDCREHGIGVLPPDVNISSVGFSIDGSIRFGLAAIKNLGEDIVLSIIAARGNLPFKDVSDFIARLDTSKMNKLKLESLVLAGAFDFTGYTRASMMDVIEQSIEYRKDIKSYESKLKTYNKKIEAFNVRNQHIKNSEIAGIKPKLKPLSLPNRPEEIIKPILKSLPEIAEKDLLGYEKELLGFYVSGHPVARFQKFIAGSAHLSTVEKIKTIGHNGAIVNLVAIPTSIEERTTKSSGKKMASMILEDLTSNINATVFPKTWEQYSYLLKNNEPLLFKCKVAVQDIDDGTISELHIQSVSTLRHIASEKSTIDLVISAEHSVVTHVHELINKYSGDETRVKISLRCVDGTTIQLPKTFSVRSGDAFHKEILDLQNGSN